MYSLGFNNLSDSPVIVLSPHQHQYDPITRAAHSWYRPQDNTKPNMAEFRRDYDDQNRNRIKLIPERPSEKKKRQMMEESGDPNAAVEESMASIPSARTPRISPDRAAEDTEMAGPPPNLAEANKSLENLFAAGQNSESITAEQYQNEDDVVEETNHRRKISRHSSRHSSASDHSRGRSDFTMTPITPITPSDPMGSMPPLEHTAIDEWSSGIGMSWSTPKDDADNHSNVKILTYDWKLEDVHIRAVNKNTHDCLVEMPSGWYIFSDGMKVGQAVARTKHEAMSTLGGNLPLDSAKYVRLPFHKEVSPMTSPAAMLQASMMAEQPAQMENLRPSASTVTNTNARDDDDSNRMDID